MRGRLDSDFCTLSALPVVGALPAITVLSVETAQPAIRAAKKRMDIFVIRDKGYSLWLFYGSGCLLVEFVVMGVNSWHRRLADFFSAATQ